MTERRHWEDRGPYEGCWEWTGCRKGAGNKYGVIYWEGRQRSIHRLAYEAIYGSIPDGLFVCHRCDNPPCFRPDHLWLGTIQDNLADMRAKGRAVNAARRLTANQVAEAREAWRGGASVAVLALSLGVSERHCRHVLMGKRWGSTLAKDEAEFVSERWGLARPIDSANGKGRLYLCPCGWQGWSTWGHARRHIEACPDAWPLGHPRRPPASPMTA